MHIPQKGYAYASKEAALSHRQAGSGNASEGSDNSDAEDSDAPQPSGPPGKQLRMPPISASAHDNDEDSDGYASVSSGSSSSSSSDGSDSEDDDDDDAPVAPAPQYPILGARARKRVRPPTSYHKQMAVYVRVCLLNLRHVTEDQPDVDLKDEDHAAFHQALREHRVERVLVADSPPPEKTSDKSPDDVGAVPRPPSSSSDKDKKRSKKSSSKESAASPTSKKAKTEAKSNPPAAAASPPPATTETKATPPPFATSSNLRAKPSSSDAASRESPPKAASTVTPPTTSALSSAKHSSSKGASSSTGGSSLDLTDSMSPADKSPVKRSMGSGGLGDSALDSSSDGHPAAKKPRLAAALPPASFQIPANADVKDMDRVRRDISKLQKEGIALKHEGDRVGRVDVAAQGVCYLRASVKFLKQALLLSDLKAMYKALNDSATASKWSKDSISTLSQTAALVESTVGFFNKAHDKRKVALSYKFAAIVMLTSYRLQHNMLYGYYSQLHAPGRSPDGGDLVSKANEDPIRSLILKEMGAMMRGFEFWRRYEACSIPDVLPTVRDPTTVDLPSLWQELDAELQVTSAGH